MKWRDWFKSAREKDLDKINVLLSHMREAGSIKEENEAVEQSCNNRITVCSFKEGLFTFCDRKNKKAWQIKLPEIDYDEKAPWA